MLATTIRVNIGLKEQWGFEVYFAFQNVYHFNVCLSVKNPALLNYHPFLSSEPKVGGGGETGKEQTCINFKIILTSFWLTHKQDITNL